MAKQAYLFPLDTGDSIAAMSTRAQKVNYLLQHVVEPGAEEYLPKLLKVMRDSKVANVVRLADDIQTATGLGGKVTMSAGDVIKQFSVELVSQLPLENDIFCAMAKTADLFPLDTGDTIAAEPTRAKKVTYFLQHVVEPGAEEYLPKLLKLMKDSKVTNLVRLADEIQAAADQEQATTSTTTAATPTIAITTKYSTDTNNAVTTTASIDHKPVPLPRHTSSSDSNIVYQSRKSTEQIPYSPDILTKNESSTFPVKPKPKPRRLKPVTNTDNEQIKCSTSPDSTCSAADNMGMVSTTQNVLEKKLLEPHNPPVLEQSPMHSEHSTNIAGHFQHSTQ